MTDIVSQIYYKGISIKIYWDNVHQNIFVENDGMCLVLPNMTVQEVIHSLGFHNNDIVVTWAKNYNLNVLDTLISEVHQHVIVISPDSPSCIISDNFDTKKDLTENLIEDLTKNSNVDYDTYNSDKLYKDNGCIQFIKKKLNYNTP